MEFNRFDICEAYYLYQCFWHDGGMTARDWARAERRPNKRPESIGVQLSRINFKPAADINLETLSDNGLIIYRDLVAKYENDVDEEAEDDYRIRMRMRMRKLERGE